MKYKITGKLYDKNLKKIVPFTLNNTGEISINSYPLQALLITTLKGYIANNYRDVLDNIDDILEFKCYSGRKIIFRYNKETEKSIYEEVLLKRLIHENKQK